MAQTPNQKDKQQDQRQQQPSPSPPSQLQPLPQLPPNQAPRSILPNREIVNRNQGSIYGQMLERKREKNKLAARRKRERKKQRLEDLESRKVELEQRRLTLRAELRARRRMNWLMNLQRHAVLNSDGEEQMPRFTPTDSSDSAFSADSFSSEEDNDDNNDNNNDVDSTNVASGSKPVYRHKKQSSSHAEGDTALGIELDKLRGEVQTACEQTMGTIKILKDIQSEVTSLLDLSTPEDPKKNVIQSEASSLLDSNRPDDSRNNDIQPEVASSIGSSRPEDCSKKDT